MDEAVKKEMDLFTVKSTHVKFLRFIYYFLNLFRTPYS
jgi:hypothetical protein